MRTNGVTGRSVLVVDDEPYIVDLVTDLLEGEGYRVRRAHDGIAALEEVDRATPDLVVADVMMPRLDGFALAARLRERGVPTILMSAAVPAPNEPGFVFIAKPFDIDRLLAEVARILDPS